MLKKINFKKNYRNFFRRKKWQSGLKEINPRRDWNIILLFFVLTLIILIVFGSYLYRKISKGNLFVVPERNEPIAETIDRSELKKIFDYYETKSRLFEENKIKKPEVIDPSL